MLLLTRPPYLRWAAAAGILLLALAWDLSKRSTEPFPFAAGPIDAGTAMPEAPIEWRNVPRGMLEPPLLERAIARVDISDGQPITLAVVTSDAGPPADWWSVPVDLPAHLVVGARVRLVLLDGTTVDGIVTAEARSDQFGLQASGAVAVPGSAAHTVAVASAADALIVLAPP